MPEIWRDGLWFEIFNFPVLRLTLNSKTGAKDMLALTRNEGESLILFLEDGKTIEIRESETKGNQASISIGAPDEVKILREELL